MSLPQEIAIGHVVATPGTCGGAPRISGTRIRVSQIVIMTEKFGLPSQLPPGYPTKLKEIIREKLPPNERPVDVDKNFMTWTFVVGTLE